MKTSQTPKFLFSLLGVYCLSRLFLVGCNILELLLQLYTLDGKKATSAKLIGSRKGRNNIERTPTWCIFIIISEPPMNSPLMNIWGKVGQCL